MSPCASNMLTPNREAAVSACRPDINSSIPPSPRSPNLYVHPGKFAFVIDPIVEGFLLPRILMDGCSRVNIIFPDTLAKMEGFGSGGEYFLIMTGELKSKCCAGLLLVIPRTGARLKLSVRVTPCVREQPRAPINGCRRSFSDANSTISSLRGPVYLSTERCTMPGVPRGAQSHNLHIQMCGSYVAHNLLLLF